MKGRVPRNTTAGCAYLAKSMRKDSLLQSHDRVCDFRYLWYGLRLGFETLSQREAGGEKCSTFFYFFLGAAARPVCFEVYSGGCRSAEYLVQCCTLRGGITHSSSWVSISNVKPINKCKMVCVFHSIYRVKRPIIQNCT